MTEFYIVIRVIYTMDKANGTQHRSLCPFSFGKIPAFEKPVPSALICACAHAGFAHLVEVPGSQVRAN